MSLTWHIVRKDVRRMGWPVGLWIGCEVIATTAFSNLRLPAEASRAILPVQWAGGVGTVFMLGAGLIAFAGAVLAAALMQEDTPVGTTAFWQTRPIKGARMLAAKTIGATLLLVVAPTAAMMMLWMAVGFSPRDTGAAALEFAAWQAVVILPAMAIGAATSNLGRFLFGALGAAVVAGTCALYLEMHWWEPQLIFRVEDSRPLVTVVMALAGALVALVSRYLTRRTWPGWSIVATLVMMGLAATGWPFDLTEFMPRLHRDPWDWPAPANADERQVRAKWEKLRGRNEAAVLTLSVENSEAPGVFFAPTRAGVTAATAGNGRSAMRYYVDRGAHWGEDAALRVAGLAKDRGPLTWEIGIGRMAEATAQLREARRSFDGSDVKMARMHATVLWEIPLRAGAVRTGSSFTRIVDLSWAEGRRTVVVQERDERLAVDEGLSRKWYNARRLEDATVDCFLVVNRAQGFARAAALEDLGVAEMNSLRLSVSALRLPEEPVPEQPAAWEQGATLIKVRFKRDGFFGLTVPGGPLTLEDDAKP